MSDALRIMEQVCTEYGITRDILRSHRRSKKLTEARKSFCRLCRDANMTTTVIARLLNRDHTTVIHHLRDRKLADGDKFAGKENG